MSISACEQSEPFALQILDDSMAPEFSTGHIVIIEPAGLCRTGCFILVEYQQCFYIRQLVNDDTPPYHCYALNQQVDDFYIDSLQAIRGVVSQRAGIRRRMHKHYY